MSVRTLERSIIRSQSVNTANFRENWKEYHDKKMESRKVAMPKVKKPKHHFDDRRQWIAYMKQMKQMIAAAMSKKKDDVSGNKTDSLA